MRSHVKDEVVGAGGDGRPMAVTDAPVKRMAEGVCFEARKPTEHLFEDQIGESEMQKSTVYDWMMRSVTFSLCRSV